MNEAHESGHSETKVIRFAVQVIAHAFFVKFLFRRIPQLFFIIACGMFYFHCFVAVLLYCCVGAIALTRQLSYSVSLLPSVS